MVYDFDRVINREQTSSVKWTFPCSALPNDIHQAPLPLWIADMDFKSPPEVLEALHQRVEHGVFGYSIVSDCFLESVINWQVHRHHWQPKAEWVVQTPGIVNALSFIIQTFTHPNDAILIQPPVYGPFYSSIQLNGRRVASAPLIEKNSHYEFDEDAFENAITPDVKIFILCNPHNPIGKVWTKAELTKMGEICLRKGVLVISDEIHQDFILSADKKHIPFASIHSDFAQNSITCTAPSKTFNIAGLQVSNLFIANEKIRFDLKQSYARAGFDEPNLLGLTACEAAYHHGGAWLDALLVYLRNNRQYLQQVFKDIPQVTLFDADALYLGWLDFRHSGIPSDLLHQTLLEKAGLWLDNGKKFGSEGAGFARINFGCPHSTLEQAVTKIKSLF